MIEFQCEKCGAQMQAPEASAGKKGRCSECGSIQQIPSAPAEAPSLAVISLNCSECGEELRVPAANAGKKGKCPKCGAINRIPKSSDKKPATSSASKAAAQKEKPQPAANSGNITFGCPQCGQSITVPEKVGGKKGKCPKCAAVIPIPKTSAKKTTAKKTAAKTKRSGAAAGSKKAKPATKTKSAAPTGSIEFNCPQCNRLVKTPASSAGKKGKCPGCQAVFDIPQTSTKKPSPNTASPTSGAAPGLTPINDGLEPLDDGLTPLGDSGLTPLGGGGGLTPVDDGGLTPVDDGGLTPVDDGGLTPVDGGGLTPVDGGGLTPVDGGGLTPVDGGGLDSLNTPMQPIAGGGGSAGQPYTPPAVASKPSSGRKKSLMVQIPAGIMIGVAGFNMILRAIYTFWTIGSGNFAAINNANFGAEQQAAMQIGAGVGIAMLIGLLIVDALMIVGFIQMFLARRYTVAIISLIVGMFLYVFPGCCCYFPLALPLNGIAMIAVIVGFVGVLMQDGKRTFID